MKFIKNLNRNLFAIILLSSIMVIGCKKEEEEVSNCSFTSLGSQMTLNGTSSNLSIAQYLANSGFDNDIMHTFQLGLIDNNCSGLTSVSFTIDVAETKPLGGTYPIKDFSAANLGDATGNYSKSILNPVSQTLEELKSGTIKITKNGTNNFTFDINATTITGVAVKLTGTRQF